MTFPLRVAFFINLKNNKIMKKLHFTILAFFTIFSIYAILIGATHHFLTLFMTAIMWLFYANSYKKTKKSTL